MCVVYCNMYTHILTEQRRFVPVPVANLQVIGAALVRLQYVQFGDVQHYAFAVSGRDSPLAPFAQLLSRFRRKPENPVVFL